MTAAMSRTRATFIGFSAILLWSLLALLTVKSAPVPPFLLNTLCFGIGGLIGLVWVIRAGEGAALRAVSWKVYAFGTLGLFGYHFLYFSALRMAPAAEAGLIAYLWPLFIVLLSGLLPGERLGALHIAGALLAFCGAALIVLRGAGGIQPKRCRVCFWPSPLPSPGPSIRCCRAGWARFRQEVLRSFAWRLQDCPPWPMSGWSKRSGRTAARAGWPFLPLASGRSALPSLPGTSG
jgi:uncharacterized membrane protein